MFCFVLFLQNIKHYEFIPLHESIQQEILMLPAGSLPYHFAHLVYRLTKRPCTESVLPTAQSPLSINCRGKI